MPPLLEPFLQITNSLVQWHEGSQGHQTDGREGLDCRAALHVDDRVLRGFSLPRPSPVRLNIHDGDTEHEHVQPSPSRQHQHQFAAKKTMLQAGTM